MKFTITNRLNAWKTDVYLKGEFINTARGWDKEKNESPTGIEPMTSRTPGERSIHWRLFVKRKANGLWFNYDILSWRPYFFTSTNLFREHFLLSRRTRPLVVPFFFSFLAIRLRSKFREKWPQMACLCDFVATTLHEVESSPSLRSNYLKRAFPRGSYQT